MVYECEFRLAARSKSGGPSLGRRHAPHQAASSRQSKSNLHFGKIGSTQFLEQGFRPCSFSFRELSRRSRQASFPLEKIRSDIGFLLDGIEIAIDAVGKQRVARNDPVFVELDRVQADHIGFGAAIRFERSWA